MEKKRDMREMCSMKEDVYMCKCKCDCEWCVYIYKLTTAVIKEIVQSTGYLF